MILPGVQTSKPTTSKISVSVLLVRYLHLATSHGHRATTPITCQILKLPFSLASHCFLIYMGSFMLLPPSFLFDSFKVVIIAIALEDYCLFCTFAHACFVCVNFFFISVPYFSNPNTQLLYCFSLSLPLSLMKTIFVISRENLSNKRKECHTYDLRIKTYVL